MYKNAVLIILILSVSFKISSGQEERTSELLSPAELIEDFDFMLRTLEETHPNLYAYIPKEEFIAKTDAFRKSINKPISKADFYKILYKTIALIKQGHTMVFGDAGFNKYKNDGGLSFPFKISYFSDHVYVEQNFSSNKELVKGTEIIAINKIPVSRIIEDFTPYLVVRPNGYIAKTLAYHWPKLLWLEYGFSDDFIISYILPNSDEIRTTNIDGVKKEFIVKNNSARYEKDFGYRIEQEQDLAVMEINTFEFQFERYDSLLKSSFNAIKQSGVNNLIIDVRANHGGNGNLIGTLVDYLTDKPYISDAKSEVKTSEATKECYTTHPIFVNAIEQARKAEDNSSDFIEFVNCFLEKPAGTITTFPEEITTPGENEYRFDGTLYVLTSANTFSGGTGFSVIIKDNDIGYIVGNETSDNPTDYGCIMLFELPNTKINIQNSTLYTVRPAGYDDGRGLIPDFKVIPTYRDLISGYDRVMNYTYWLIEEDIANQTIK
ncbi:MAG: S41 family peptidase [Bacteroidota bacterium]